MPNQDQIIDAVMARSIQADGERTHALLAWVVMRGKFSGRLSRRSG
jgi:hypothetical protein